MILRLLAQVILATSLFQMFPADAGVIERHARLPSADARAETPGAYEITSLMSRPLPIAPAAQRKPIKAEPTSIGVVTSAVSAMVVDRASGSVLYEKNTEEPRSIGSMTKLMTAFVFLQGHPNLEAPAALEPEDVRSGGIQHLAVGDQVTVHDILLASLVGSDNSATAALARLSGMSEADFVAKMNETAADLGLRHTTFVDETGLSADNRSIAPDLIRLLDRAMKEDAIRNTTEQPVVAIRGASGRVYSVQSTNELLGTFMDKPPYHIVGGKTGYLPEAGYCFGAIVSKDDGHEIIVVVLGSDSKDGRFQDAKALAAWAYKVFKWPDQKS